MNWLDSDQRYGAVSRAIHWSMAVLLVLMLGSGWLVEAFEGLGEAQMMGLHKSVGVLRPAADLAGSGDRVAGGCGRGDP